MDPLQEFYITRLAAEIVYLIERNDFTVSTFARRIGVPVNTVSRWARAENRPRTKGQVRRVAEVLHLTLEEVIFLFWGCKDGDPCPEHDWCGGEMIMPTSDKAQGMDIRIKCQRCGKEKEYRGMRRHRRHWRKVCGHCSRIEQSAGLVPLKCLYCPKEKEMRRSDLRRSLRANPSSAANEDQGSYVCLSCYHKRRSEEMRLTLKDPIVRWRRKTVKDYLKALKGASTAPSVRRRLSELTKESPFEERELPIVNFTRKLPKIESVVELSRIRRAITRMAKYLSDGDTLDAIGKAVKAALDRVGDFPYSENLTERGHVERVYSKTSRSIAQFLRYAKEGRASFVKGPCQICQIPIFSTWPARVHKPCGYGKGSAKLNPKKKRGGQPDPQSQFNQYLWLMNIAGGRSLGEIAKDFGGVTRRAVSLGTKSFIIPEEKLLPVRFHELAQFLKRFQLQLKSGMITPLP